MIAETHLTDDQLSAHLDSALADDSLLPVAEHLDQCDQCAARLQRLRATSQAVASLPEVELPRPLDFGFLNDTATAVAESGRGFVARVIHGGMPTWVPTAVAAAAVLALAITWAPRVLPNGGGGTTATTALQTTSHGGAVVAPSSAGTTADKSQGSANLNLTPGGNAFSAPLPAQVAPEAAQRTVIGPDGSTITMVANPSSGHAGRPVQLLLRIIGGPRGTNLAAPGMEIFVGQGQAQVREAGTEGTNRTLKAGEELDLTVDWSAGALSAPPAAGSYSLIGRVFMTLGTTTRLVEASLTYAVSG